MDVLSTNLDWWLSRDVLAEIIRRELYFQRSGNIPTQAQVGKRLERHEAKGSVEVDKSNPRRHLYRLIE